MTIDERQNEIIEDFSEVDDWMDRYQMLIDLGNGQQPLPAEDKKESNLIEGCQSRLWLICEEKEGKLFFRAHHRAPVLFPDLCEQLVGDLSYGRQGKDQGYHNSHRLFTSSGYCMYSDRYDLQPVCIGG